MLLTLTLCLIVSLAAIALLAWRLFHRSPDATMPDNTKLLQLSTDLATATTCVGTLSQQLATTTHDLAIARQETAAAESRAAALQTQLDALPDADTVAIAASAMENAIATVNSVASTNPSAAAS